MAKFSIRGAVRRGAVGRSLGGVLLALGLGLSGAAKADRIKHPIAVFSGLDKITGRIISFEVATDETVQFGTLQITQRACYTRPATEAPQTITFVEVDEVDAKNEYKRIFSGWMFAASPGLHGVEHPIYDIWLTDCKGGKEVVASPAAGAETPPPPPPNAVAAPDGAPPPKKPKPPRRVQPQPPQPPVDNFGAEPLFPDQGGAPVEVGPPPGARAPRQRRAPADDFDSLVPPGDIPDQSPQRNFPGDRF